MVISAGGSKMVDLTRAVPPVPPELEASMRLVLSTMIASNTIGQTVRHNRIGGDARDRIAGARWVSRRLNTRIEQDRLIVGNGTQSLLGLIFYEVLGANSVLLTEALTYPVLKPLAQRFGISVEPVRIDELGLIPSDLENAIGRTCAKAIFCNPTIQNPTTAVMPEDRRAILVSIARRHNVVIIEDDVLGALHGLSPRPLAAIGPDVVWYIQSLSKCVALGLRVAYLVAPDAVQRDRLVASAANHSFWFPSGLAAEAATTLIESGEIQRVAGAIRTESEVRRQIAVSILGKHGIRSQAGGLHIWLPVEKFGTALSFTAAADRIGVKVRPAEMFAASPADERLPIPAAVRVALTSPNTHQELVAGLDHLARLLGNDTHPVPATSQLD
ncbi:hypothetical protein CQ10_37585 [Bradyrhizobium valentinum]|nr:hypothetical protein CQ10_37585 [Bradyrhizobium valentinum]